jgi:acyl CoA:acetate/3-ketoacid CoA transferase alpha subunit
MCMAAENKAAQASSIEAVGFIDPERIVTPDLFVDIATEMNGPREEEMLIREEAAYP